MLTMSQPPTVTALGKRSHRSTMLSLPSEDKQRRINPPSTPSEGKAASATPSSVSIKTTPQGQIATKFVSETKLPTDFGMFRVRAYRCSGQTVGHAAAMEPVALICDTAGPLSSTPSPRSAASSSSASLSPTLPTSDPVAVRVHDACATSEIFASRRCDCREQLHCAMEYVQQHGGIIIYLQQEGRGIGLANKIAAYALQEAGADTVDANRMLGFEDDLRLYEPVKAILDDIGVEKIVLMTNNPRKVAKLSCLGINVQGRIPIVARVTRDNAAYLKSKAERMHHIIGDVTDVSSMPPSRDGGVSLPLVRRAFAGKIVHLPSPSDGIDN